MPQKNAKEDGGEPIRSIPDTLAKFFLAICAARLYYSEQSLKSAA
jgi:hypothetical protein